MLQNAAGYFRINESITKATALKILKFNIVANGKMKHILQISWKWLITEQKGVIWDSGV